MDKIKRNWRPATCIYQGEIARCMICRSGCCAKLPDGRVVAMRKAKP